MNVICEPLYDADRLLTDKAYQFEMFDKFKYHIKSLEPFSEKAEYFLKIYRALSGEQPQFGLKRITLDMREDGKLINLKSWQLDRTNDEERETARKVWFLTVRHEQFKEFGQWKHKTLAARQATYYDQLPDYDPATLAKRHLKSVKAEIKRFRRDYWNFQAGLQGYQYVSDEVRQQQADAPALIESEQLGNRAIHWLKFSDYRQLQPFAFLWDMIAYRLFLIREIKKPQHGTISPATIGGQSKKPPARPFANFIDKLQNGFTEEDLNGLLIHVNFKNKGGETLPFTRYLMHHVIDALVKKEYFERGNVEYDQKALSRYLGIKETRVTVESGKPKKSVKNKAESYLSELKNQRKNNG